MLWWNFALAPSSTLLTSFTGIKQRKAEDWGVFAGLGGHHYEGCFLLLGLMVFKGGHQNNRHCRNGRRTFPEACLYAELLFFPTAVCSSPPDLRASPVLTPWMMNCWGRGRESQALPDVWYYLWGQRWRMSVCLCMHHPVSEILFVRVCTYFACTVVRGITIAILLLWQLFGIG